MLRMLAGEAARRFGGRTAFAAADPAGHPAGHSVGFAGLDRLSDEVAAGLAARGVLPGDVVALALPPAPELPICYLAAAKIGAISARYDPAWPAGRLARVHAIVRPRLTIAGPGEPAEQVDPGESGEVATVDVAAGPDRSLAALARPERPPPPMPPDPGRPVAVAFSAGTTGLPKGALYGDRQLDAIRLATLGQRWGTGGSLVATGAAVPSASFAHPDLLIAMPLLLQGGYAVHLAPAGPRAGVEMGGAALAALTAGLGCAQLAGTPGQLEGALASTPPAGLDLDGIDAVVVTGGPAPAELVRALRERFGVPVCVRYTCAETGLGIGTRPGDPAEDAESSVGRPAAGVIIAVRDPAGRPMPRGEVGEVLLRSAAVMNGYWNEPDETARAIAKDGFVRTGDLGRVDETGRVHIVGRREEGQG